MTTLRGTLRKLMVVAVALVVTATTAAAGTTGRQLLFYNHAWGTIDAATADAIEDSAYIREFANFQIRTATGAGGQTWTGRYLLGRETYLELFGEGDLPGQDGQLGAAGLGVSTERDGDLATVAGRLTAPIEFTQTRDFGDGVPVPWFDAIFTTTTYDAFGAWGMEYRPEYLADPRANVEPASFPGDVGRERYLSDDYRTRLARDITEVHLGVTAGDLASTLPLLRAGGFVVRELPGGAVVNRGGTTLRFDAVPRADAGLRGVEFVLNRPAARHVEQIGASTLTVGGTRAVWTF
ncbi:hypothetical protein J2S43_003144 [Catenuloplanes nepalensis]|uniref:Uncharacterized protein n=1 Tax=Catenuloplanes nepalensis TaxID=587533 RepID=A0ABT9MT64_9ACTN|nr:DUF5829 family protein [Catenuloplanes nepalensis]MDP9794632.1 hypothetical protein [Catenuloplanes nepalensis]